MDPFFEIILYLNAEWTSNILFESRFKLDSNLFVKSKDFAVKNFPNPKKGKNFTNEMNDRRFIIFIR